jgi:protein ImuB
MFDAAEKKARTLTGGGLAEEQPSAVRLRAVAMFACIHADDAAKQAESFSPFIEMVDARTAVFSVTPRQIERVRKIPGVAVAETVEGAVLAARNPGLELDELPVDALPPDPEMFQVFDLWGIRTLGDLARLPEDGIAERLGARGVELQRLAGGRLERPLRPARSETIYEQQIDLDYAITQLEPLLFLMHRFLIDLCVRVEAASALVFTFGREVRRLPLPFPTRDVKFLLKLVQHEIEAHPPAAPPQKIGLRVEPAEPRRVQHGLFTPAAPEPEKLELTLGKIRALVGAKNVKIPELKNSYRPGWSLPDSPLAFRYFRPPLPARVETEQGIPRRLFGKKIVDVAGPWRSSGEWWRRDEWNRDEWDLRVADGTLLRIFRAEGVWFLEGEYD